MEDDHDISFKTLQKQCAANRSARHRPSEVANPFPSLKNCVDKCDPACGRSAHRGPAAVQHLWSKSAGMRLLLQLQQQMVRRFEAWLVRERYRRCFSRSRWRARSTLSNGLNPG